MFHLIMTMDTTSGPWATFIVHLAVL